MRLPLVPALLAMVALPLAANAAPNAASERPFAFKIEGQTLHIFAPDGKEVGKGISTATVGQTVSAPPYSFQVSFGSDAGGNLSIIVSPDPEHPAPLTFTMNNQQVHMDAGSVATVTQGAGGATQVQAGLTGGVKVTSASSPSSPTTASAPANGANNAANAAPTAPTAPTAPSPVVVDAANANAAGSTVANNNAITAPPTTALPPAAQNNLNPIATLVVNAPTVAAPTVNVAPDIVVVQTAAGPGVASSQNINAPVTLQDLSNALSSGASSGGGGSQSIGGGAGGVSVTTTTSSGTTVTTTPPATTPI